MKLKNKAEDPTHAILGKSTDGKIINSTISKFPHALIAGATGSGKSVFLNSMLITTMAIAHPDELKLIIIDPKGNEFGNYKNLPYMLTNPIIDMDKAKNALEYLATLMDVRFQKFQKYGGKKNLKAFNDAVDSGEITDEEKMPYVVLLIDEFFDLMSTHKDEVEGSIKRLGAKARAAGVHMLIATQSPRREVVTGLIKANVPTKISLMVSSSTESMIILGDTGAEKLKPHGDFYASINNGKWVRGQGTYISDEEIEDIFNNLKENYPAPELIDIDDELESIKLDFQRIKAENNGEDPDSVTVEDIQSSTSSSNKVQFTASASNFQSRFSKEEKEERLKQHERTKQKIEENRKNNEEGKPKTVTLDGTMFSKAKRNEMRKEAGEPPLKKGTGKIPLTKNSTQQKVDTKTENEKSIRKDNPTANKSDKPESQSSTQSRPQNVASSSKPQRIKKHSDDVQKGSRKIARRPSSRPRRKTNNPLTRKRS